MGLEGTKADHTLKYAHVTVQPTLRSWWKFWASWYQDIYTCQPVVVQQPEELNSAHQMVRWESLHLGLLEPMNALHFLFYSLPVIVWSHEFQLGPANPFTNQILKIIDNLYFISNWSQSLIHADSWHTCQVASGDSCPQLHLPVTWH